MGDDQQDRASKSVEEFGAILEPFADAMNAGRFDESQALILAAFQFVAENPIEPTDTDKRQAEADQAEKCGDWQAAERIYQSILQVENCEPRGAHSRLARLYEFLGLSEKSLLHGRMAYDLCRDHEVEMVGVMGAVALAQLSVANTVPAEIESALRSSLASLRDEPMFAHLRAQSLTEIANARRTQFDASQARQLVDQAIDLLATQSDLHGMPGYQRTIARAWQVRAMTQSATGNLLASAESWKTAIDWKNRVRCCFEDETAIDADHHSKFLQAAAEGLRAAGERAIADERSIECNRLRSEWQLPTL